VIAKIPKPLLELACIVPFRRGQIWLREGLQVRGCLLLFAWGAEAWGLTFWLARLPLAHVRNFKGDMVVATGSVGMRVRTMGAPKYTTGVVL